MNLAPELCRASYLPFQLPVSHSAPAFTFNGAQHVTVTPGLCIQTPPPRQQLAGHGKIDDIIIKKKYFDSM